jgi:hypothetical protein
MFAALMLSGELAQADKATANAATDKHLIALLIDDPSQNWRKTRAIAGGRVTINR